MGKLTCLPDAGASVVRAPRHNFRLLSGRVLITSADGGHAFLSPADYRLFLKGELSDSHPALARFGGSALSGTWHGPTVFKIIVSRRARAMTLETAKRAVDFIFSTPAPWIEIHLIGADAKSRPAAWFIAEYARRKSEWYRREHELLIRQDAAKPLALTTDLFKSRGAALELMWRLEGAPGRSPAWWEGFKKMAPVAAAKSRALARMGPLAKDPGGWVDLWTSMGLGRVTLEPGTMSTGRALKFYGEALKRMAQGGKAILEQRAAAFSQLLKGENVPWSGVDILGELAIDETGRVFASEAGLEFDRSRLEPIFQLGDVAESDYARFIEHPMAQTTLAAGLPDHQPLCFQCAYKPYCRTSPAKNLATQGSLWGQQTSNTACSFAMGAFDILFGMIRPSSSTEAE